METIQTSTTYFTSAGPIEVPGPDIPIPDLQATRNSNLAPLWLVFPDIIVNTRRITSLELKEGYIRIGFGNGYSRDVYTTDLDKTWKALQTVFTEGLS